MEIDFLFLVWLLEGPLFSRRHSRTMARTTPSVFFQLVSASFSSTSHAQIPSTDQSSLLRNQFITVLYSSELLSFYSKSVWELLVGLLDNLNYKGDLPFYSIAIQFILNPCRKFIRCFGQDIWPPRLISFFWYRCQFLTSRIPNDAILTPPFYSVILPFKKTRFVHIYWSEVISLGHL